MRVSIIRPVHDAYAVLLRDVGESVLSPGGDVVAEVILVDAASRDAATIPAAQSLIREEDRVRSIRAERNGGPAAARNRGMAQAEGDWIGLLDADDLWLSGRLEAGCSLLQREDATCIGARHVLPYHAGTTRVAPSIAGVVPTRRGEALARPDLTRPSIAKFRLHSGATLVRADLARHVNGFADGLRYFEDQFFPARLSVIAPLHMLNFGVCGWRRVAAA